MLSEVLQAQYIQTNVEAENFEEAVRKAMAPLVADEAVTAEYVAKIIEIYRETGPYIVITKHVALPHAPSKFGALKTALGITILNTAVVSGNEENDPVKYLFALSASDGETHLEALADLVSLLSDEAFFEVLNHETSPENILTFIREKERNEKHA